MVQSRLESLERTYNRAIDATMKRKTLLILILLFLPFTAHLTASSETTSLESMNEVFIESDQSQLFCRTIGEGKPLIVVHGGPGLTQDYLLPQLLKLAKNNFVIFYDQRGCGQSTGDINLDTINIPTFVNDLDNIRKAFNFETVSLLGHSWGGLLTMHYAVAYPECIDQLILSNSMPASTIGMVLFVNEWLRRMAPYQDEIAEIYSSPGFEEGDPDLIERLHRTIFRAYCYCPEKADLLNVRMNATAAVNGANVYALIYQNEFKRPFDLHESLNFLKIPTLIIHGDSDIVPAITAHYMQQSLVGSELVMMKNCGHFPFVEDPETFFKHINNFLN